jgi:hypothetical protein
MPVSDGTTLQIIISCPTGNLLEKLRLALANLEIPDIPKS